MQDPIADMLTRIRNAQQASKDKVVMPSSKLKVAIANVLKDEGYIADIQVVKSENKPELVVFLKYYEGRPVINTLKRISRPSIRIYREKKELKKVPGFGVVILSTSRGVVSDRVARKLGVGGELLCEVG